MRIYTLIIIALIFLIACIESPTPPKNSIGEYSEHGAYILCEGLYGQNNSSLSRYDMSNSVVYNNFFQMINNSKIGDTANDILIKGDTTYIVVSTQKKIVLLQTISGKIITELAISEGRFLRKMAILNDSILLVTDLYCHCFWVVNIETHAIIQKVPTGPAPEGIAVFGGYIFVANSGLGDYLSQESKAGTVSVYDSKTMIEIKLFDNLANVIELKLSLKNSKLYVRYNNLPKYKDSLGGIAEFDINELFETRRWYDRSGQFVLSSNNDSLFYLCDEGIKLIELNENESKPKLIIAKSKPTDYWYSIAIYKDNLWIGNAKDYQSNGEILIFDINSLKNYKEKFNVGLNPNTIVFF